MSTNNNLHHSFGTQSKALTHFDPLQHPIDDFYKFMQIPGVNPRIDLLRRHRLKEWHYFHFIGEEHAITLKLLQMGYMAICSYSAYEFKTRKIYTQTEKAYLPLLFKNPLHFAKNSLEDSSIWESSKSHIKIKQSPDKFDVEISGTFPQKSKGGDLFARFIVQRKAGLSLSYPFAHGRSAYTHKELALEAKGSAKFGLDAVSTHTGKYKVLSNWTKGVLPRESKWNWAAFSFVHNNKKFDLNLSQFLYDDQEGRSFENTLWIDDQMFPLGKAIITHKEDQRARIDVLPLPKISPVPSLTLNFEPLYETKNSLNFGFVKGKNTRPLGLFTGTINCDLFPSPIKIEEGHGALGLIENHWALW